MPAQPQPPKTNPKASQGQLGEESSRDSSLRRQLWMAALKPPIYSVAIMPIWVGSAIAYAQVGAMDVEILLVFLGAAVCLLAWVNLSNDVFDAQTGVDKNKLHSLVNLTGKPAQVFWVGNAFLALGLAGILWLSWRQGDPTVLLLVLLACGLGYAYQGPPLRLGYQGLGEILCFLSFGPLAVLAAHYSQSRTWSLPALAASVVVGIATSLILFCSHFHQVEDDQRCRQALASGSPGHPPLRPPRPLDLQQYFWPAAAVCGAGDFPSLDASGLCRDPLCRAAFPAAGHLSRSAAAD
jgi:1,4-dihydroxy-2-naphthoate octaprenyltransferase